MISYQDHLNNLDFTSSNFMIVIYYVVIPYAGTMLVQIDW